MHACGRGVVPFRRYVNNLPVDTMFDLFNPESVVAVDVEDKDNSSFTGVENFGDSLSVRCHNHGGALSLFSPL